MSTIATIQVHETFYNRNYEMPRRTWPNLEYLQPASGQCQLSHQHNNNTKCVGIQLMYSNGDWHSNATQHLPLQRGANTRHEIIAAIQDVFEIHSDPGDAEQQGLLRVSDETWNPIPLNYNSIETSPKQILVVHLLAKIVSFRVEHVLDMNYYGRELCIQVSAHDSLLEVKRAAHTVLHLKANQTIDFQDGWGNIIQPTWRDFPHRPHG
jgi:hypothetical protein